MKISLCFVCLALIQHLHADPPAKIPPGKLLDETIANPGGYSQMCDIQFVERAAPLPLYALSLDSEFQLSTDMLAKLRSHRTELIPELVSRLAKLDLMRKPKTTEIKFKEGPDVGEEITNSGLDPQALSQILLKVITDLNATECLPGLVKLEKELALKLEANAADPTKPLPEIQSDAGFVVGTMAAFDAEIQARDGKELSPKEQAERDAIHQRVAAIVAQRDLLATMLCLLRQEKFPPLLKSNFETTFARSVETKAKEENLANLKKPADIKDDEASYIGFDPLLKLPLYPARKTAEVKYTAEVRQQVLDLVQEFLTSIPAEKRLGAKGMTASIYVR